MEVKILNGRTHFYQWDSEQKFIVDDANVNELHFTNNAQEDASVVSCYEQEGIKLCDIPNSYLEKNGILTVYAFTYENGNYTKNTFRFNVIERPKPNDYVVEEEEINRWGELDSQIKQVDNKAKNLEKNVADLQDDKAEKNHTHQYYMITGLQEKLNEKSNNGHTHGIDDVGNLSTILNDLRKNDRELNDGKADKTHTHNISDVLGLQSRLDNIASKGHNHDERYYQQHEVRNLLNGKANSNHAHDINDIFLLQYNLDKKADTSHNHDSSYYKKTEVDDLMKNATVSDEKIDSSVEKYLNENPIEGGASSWNDLEDRPFGDEIIYGNIISLNNQSNKTFTMDGMTCVKVSDFAPTYEQFYNCTISYSNDRTFYNFKIYDHEKDILDYREQGIPCLMYRIKHNQDDYGFGVLIVFEDFNYPDMGNIEKGTYFRVKDMSFPFDVTQLEFTEEIVPNTITHKLNNKFLNLEWLPISKMKDGELIHEETLEFKTNIFNINSDFANQLSNGKYKVIWNGVEYETKVFVIISGNVKMIIFGNIPRFNPDFMSYVGTMEDTGEPYLYSYCILNGEVLINRFEKDLSNAETVDFKIYELIEKPNPIPNKFLPSHLQFGGDEYTTDEFVLDESSTDYETVTVEDTIGVKITDYAPTVEQLIGGTVGFYNNDVYFEEPIIEEDIQDMREQGIPMLMIGYGLLIVYEDNAMMGVSVTKGIWFMVGDYFYISKLKLTEHITVGEIKKLDSKYIPTFGSTENVNVLVEEGTYELNGEEMGMQTINFVDVPKRTNDTFIVSWNGTEYEYPTLIKMPFNEGVTWHLFGNVGAMNEMLGGNYPITNEPFIGAYVDFTDGSQQKNIVIVPLDGSTSANIKIWQEKENNLLIQSPNGKVFKLVVDDDGNLLTMDSDGNIKGKPIDGNEVAY